MSSKLLSSKDWKNRKFHEIALVKMGQSPPSATYNNQGLGLPFYQGNKDFGLKYPNKTIFCSGPKRIAEEGEILFSVRAPIGDINIAIEKSCIGRGLSSISMRNGNNDFLYYLLKFNSNKIKSFFETDGTVFGCLTKDDLNNFDILVPENPIEQKAIAKVLSDLDDKIELNNEMNKTLEEVGQALFKRWFIDFEFPDENGNPYRSSGGEMVYSKELGKEIPKGWEVGKLGDILAFVKGKKPSMVTDSYEEGYKIQILIETLNGGISSYANPNNMILTNKYDLIMVMDGASSGRVEMGHEGVLGSTLSKVELKQTQIDVFYLYYLLKRMEKDINKNTTGTSIPHVDKGKILNQFTIIPNKYIFVIYTSLVRNIINKIIEKRKENEILSELRDSLLPKLMSGEIRVPLEATQ
jgi:type I restriction enzyme S subunit